MEVIEIKVIPIYDISTDKTYTRISVHTAKNVYYCEAIPTEANLEGVIKGFRSLANKLEKTLKYRNYCNE